MSDEHAERAWQSEAPLNAAMHPRDVQGAADEATGLVLKPEWPKDAA
ncbi:MAG TPA: hypothetical protein VF495_04790 [Phenylobacterium sp.]